MTRSATLALGLKKDAPLARVVTLGVQSNTTVPRLAIRLEDVVKAEMVKRTGAKKR